MGCLERMFQIENGHVCHLLMRERMAFRFSDVEMTENLEKSSFPKTMGSETRLDRVNGGNSDKQGG